MRGRVPNALELSGDLADNPDMSAADDRYNRSEKGRARWLRYAHKMRGEPFASRRTPEQWDHVFGESTKRDQKRPRARIAAHDAMIAEIEARRARGEDEPMFGPRLHIRGDTVGPGD